MLIDFIAISKFATPIRSEKQGVATNTYPVKIQVDSFFLFHPSCTVMQYPAFINQVKVFGCCILVIQDLRINTP